jgi:hypothetical protein|tara:strand:+ start:1492 stop:1650 length:159 start_codon:yes stop_codon:yes gene_type:complete
MKYKKKHKKLITDYEGQKSKHLERLATKSLERDEKIQKLKSKEIKGNFLNLF